MTIINDRCQAHSLSINACSNRAVILIRSSGLVCDRMSLSGHHLFVGHERMQVPPNPTDIGRSVSIDAELRMCSHCTWQRRRKQLHSEADRNGMLGGIYIIVWRHSHTAAAIEADRTIPHAGINFHSPRRRSARGDQQTSDVILVSATARRTLGYSLVFICLQVQLVDRITLCAHVCLTHDTLADHHLTNLSTFSCSNCMLIVAASAEPT